MAKNLPQETGFYWARTESRFNWYNLIVKVSGDAPFFTMTGWLLSALNDVVGSIALHQIHDFGPRISEPESPPKEVK